MEEKANDDVGSRPYSQIRNQICNTSIISLTDLINKRGSKSGIHKKSPSGIHISPIKKDISKLTNRPATTHDMLKLDIPKLIIDQNKSQTYLDRFVETTQRFMN
jgi:hypothetical protein